MSDTPRCDEFAAKLPGIPWSGNETESPRARAAPARKAAARAERARALNRSALSGRVAPMTMTRLLENVGKRRGERRTSVGPGTVQETRGGARDAGSARMSFEIAVAGAAGRRGSGTGRMTNENDAGGAETKSLAKHARHGSSATTRMGFSSQVPDGDAGPRTCVTSPESLG